MVPVRGGGGIGIKVYMIDHLFSNYCTCITKQYDMNKIDRRLETFSISI